MNERSFISGAAFMSEVVSEKVENKKAEIIQAAYQLFLKNGYHGTSMRQIAQSAEIALGGIYNHFNSKEEIFVAVIQDFHPFFDVIPVINKARGDTLEEIIRDAARRMISGLGNRPDFLNMMFIELVEFNGEHIPALFDLFFPKVREFAMRFFKDNAGLRPVPVFVLARAFIGLFFSFYITELLIGKQLPNQEHALDYFVDIFLHGILVQSQ
jgi:AcrR family transcriptional regulator